MNILQWTGADWGGFAEVATLAGVLGGGIVNLYLSSRYAKKTTVEALATKEQLLAAEKRIVVTEDAIVDIKANMATLATSKDMSEIKLALSRSDGQRDTLAANVLGLRDQVAEMGRSLRMVEKHLMGDRS